jgi:hypothetical protein
VDLGALASKTYDGTTGSGAIGGSDYSIAPGVVLGGAGSDLSYQSNNKNAGNYSAKDGGLLVSGLYSNQQGYDISYQGSFEITQASLTVTADAASKVYGDADDLKYTSSGLIHGDSLGGKPGPCRWRKRGQLCHPPGQPGPQQLQHHVQATSCRSHPRP